MLKGLSSLGALALASTLLLGCIGEVGGPGEERPVIKGETQAEGTSLETVLEQASADHDVPVAILASIAWTETRWQMIEGEAEHEGMAPAHGIMALRGERLEQGATLAGEAVEDVETDMAANVNAAAALLSSYADELAVDRADLGSWAPAVAKYSGIEEVAGQAQYVHDEVYRTLRAGIDNELLRLDPIEVTPKFVLMDGNLPSGPNYKKSVWHPSPNYSSRPGGSGGTPQMVIIHTCEGSYSGCWSWLASSKSGVSAHYVVNNTGSEISQLVNESKKAWHIAAKYKCSLNGDTSCKLNGSSGNNFTVGIEHAGYAKQSSWDKGLIAESAQLTCDITKDQGIARDKFHIVGHGQLQPYNRIDPGPNWPWAKYLSLVNDYCNGQSPPQQNPPQQPPPQDPPPQDPPPQDPPPQDPPPKPGSWVTTIDSNNALNGGGAECVVSGNWTASKNVSGYFNTGYWWRSTGASADAAEFRAYLDAPRKVKVEAWWPAASDRSPKAPFLVFDGNGGHIDTVLVNQQQQGGNWVQIGVYQLTKGWNTVALSRWTDPGYVVVADAVRLTEVP